MAYAAINSYTPDAAGLLDTEVTLTEIATGAGNGIKIPNTAGDKAILFIKNTTGAPINATLITQFTADSLALPDKVIAVPANGWAMIANLKAHIYNTDGGMVNVEAAGAGLEAALIVP